MQKQKSKLSTNQHLVFSFNPLMIELNTILSILLSETKIAIEKRRVALLYGVFRTQGPLAM